LIVVAHLLVEAREAVVGLGRRLRLDLVAVDLEVVVALHADQVLVGVEQALGAGEFLEAALGFLERRLEGLELDAALDELGDGERRARARHVRACRFDLPAELPVAEQTHEEANAPYLSPALAFGSRRCALLLPAPVSGPPCGAAPT